MLKCANKIVLKDRTVVSPGKIRYFWDFGWSYIQKLTSTTHNFHNFWNIYLNWATTRFFEYFFGTLSKNFIFWIFLAFDARKNWRQAENWRQHWRHKKYIFEKNIFSLRQCWCQFSVRHQIFLTSHAQKFSKMQFLERAPKKTSKNGVDAQIRRIISKVMPKWKFWVVTSIFLYNFTQNLRNIEFSQAKRLSYLLELFLLAHSGEI